MAKKNAEKEYAHAVLKAKASRRKAPDYHLFGLPIAVAQDIRDYIDDASKSLMAEYDPTMNNNHVREIFANLKVELQNREYLGEAVIIPPGMQHVVTHLVKPDTASYVIAGAALGISMETVYHIFAGLWSRVKDFYDGSHIDAKELRAYAVLVRKHVNKKTQVMIDDLRRALHHSDYIKAAQIQKELRDYGARVGLHEDGAVAGGAPTNNVGSGNIAGAKGDPPGPSKLLKKVVRRRKIAGQNVFEVSGEYFAQCKEARKKNAFYETYVDDEEIRAFGKNNPRESIVLENSDTGSLVCLRYGKNKKKE